MLIQIATACAFLTVAITSWAALADSKHGKGQSIRASMAETWTNIFIGFGINYVANLVVLPLAGFDVGAEDAFYIGVIFTAISVVRSFALRRFYNWLMVRSQERSA